MSIVFVGIPLAFKFSNSLRRLCVFRNTADLPKNSNYSNLKAFGLEGTTNLYMYHQGLKLGVWHIQPSNISSGSTSNEEIWSSLNQRSVVILYNHGNSGSRGSSYRIDLYKVLRKSFHVITYDYRGFGDSSGGRPTSEKDVIEDGLFMARWVLRHLPEGASLILWGHSMGSSVVLAATRALSREKLRPSAIILESTFYNGRETIPQTPMLRFFSFLPWFDSLLMDPLMDSIGKFQNNEYITDIDCPILMLHSEDDGTISYKHAEKLYNEVLKKNSGSNRILQFELISKSSNCGHNHITRAPELAQIVRNFVNKAINENEKLDPEKQEEEIK